MPGSFALPLDFAPMEARTAESLPQGEGWLYEPKWDGFRCLAFRSGADVELRSKSGQPLGRYFPDVAGALAAARRERFVADGELLVPKEGGFDFEELQLRLHPAASRVAKLVAAHPAVYVLFDLLALDGELHLERPLRERRPLLEAFHATLNRPISRCRPRRAIVRGRSPGSIGWGRRWTASSPSGWTSPTAPGAATPW